MLQRVLVTIILWMVCAQIGECRAQNVFPLRIGAGGQITGIDIQCDQGVGACNKNGTTTKAIRTDTGGGYIYNSNAANPGNAGGTGVWQQVVTTSSVPSANYGLAIAETANGAGVFEIRIAPSNTSVLYMVFNGYVLVTTNKGATWTDTRFSHITAGGNNTLTKFMGPFIAIDPANADVVIFGTPSNGLWYTTNGTRVGGAAWTQISSGSVAAANGGGAYLVAFDPTSPVTDGKTQGIFVSSYGKGIYHATAGLSGSWTLTGNGPTTHHHMVVASDGVVWFTDGSGGPNGLWTYNSGTWSHNSVSNGDGWWTVAVDPNNAARAVIAGAGGEINVTTNHGLTWAGINRGFTRVATDIPWLAWTNETFMTNGNQVFDPAGSNSLWFAEGIGVWNANPPDTVTAFDFTSISSGIEQLVANGIISPWTGGGLPLVFGWDRPIFQVVNPNVFPSAHGLSRAVAISAGWGADWASSAPANVFFQTGSANSGSSSSGGACTPVLCSWVAFSAVPAGFISNGGSMAASTPTNVLWQESDNGDPWYTTNGGRSWNVICISGVPCDTTSSSTVVIATSGSKTFTVPSCTSLPTGGAVTTFENADRSGYGMNGRVTSCSETTLTMAVSGAFCSGGCTPGATSFSSWVVRPETGWGNAHYVASSQVCADRADANTFYMWNAGPAGLSPTAEGIYKTADGGATWTRVATGKFSGAVAGVIPRLKCVPNNSGHAFFTKGIVIGTGAYPHAGIGLYRTKDHGTTWANVSNGSYKIGEVWDFGFGNACGGSYPVIFLYGWINGTGGVWRSKDNAATWQQLTGLYPLGWIDQLTSIEGDANICGRFYAGFKGTGWEYGQFN